MINTLYNKVAAFVIFLVTLLLLSSCSTPNSQRYKRINRGSSMYYKRANSYHYKAGKNVIPISKNYRIKNKRTSGRY